MFWGISASALRDILIIIIYNTYCNSSGNGVWGFYFHYVSGRGCRDAFLFCGQLVIVIFRWWIFCNFRESESDSGGERPAKRQWSVYTRSAGWRGRGTTCSASTSLKAVEDQHMAPRGHYFCLQRKPGPQGLVQGQAYSVLQLLMLYLYNAVLQSVVANTNKFGWQKCYFTFVICSFSIYYFARVMLFAQSLLPNFDHFQATIQKYKQFICEAVLSFTQQSMTFFNRIKLSSFLLHLKDKLKYI